MRALLRRAAPSAAALDVIRFGNCELDFTRAGAALRGQAGGHHAAGIQSLGLFARRPGRVLTRRVLIDEVWGRETMITERVVDNQIANLRKKIEPCAGGAELPQERARHRVQIRSGRCDRSVTKRWSDGETQPVDSLLWR